MRKGSGVYMKYTLKALHYGKYEDYYYNILELK